MLVLLCAALRSLLFLFSDAPSGEGEAQLKRPVIIHRAILGSVERFMAILTENFAGKPPNNGNVDLLVFASIIIVFLFNPGKWPFWISPRQVLVIPVVSAMDDYGLKVQKQLHDAGFMTSIDTDPGRTLNKKIRNGQLSQFNFILGNSSVA